MTVARITRILARALVLMAMLTPAAARAADAVTRWTLVADGLGGGGANWRTLAIMHMAMHDALNAVEPHYARWAPPEPDEPKAAGASAEAALASAAAEVLRALHPDHGEQIGIVLKRTLAGLPPGPAVDAGVQLGKAIGYAAMARRLDDGYERRHEFPSSEAAGKWRPTPPAYPGSNTTESQPFLFATPDDYHSQPPPALGSAEYLRDISEEARMGVLNNSGRTAAQTYAAQYWAFQSSQRGFVRLAVALLDVSPRPGGLAEHARIMSQLTAAMADSAIMVWLEKEHYSAWRPITAIHLGGFGVTPDPDWEPLLETPAHPEYPSGHACDCFVGGGFLASVFGPSYGPIRYIAQSGLPDAMSREVGMGQHNQGGGLVAVERRFPTLAAAADECSESRIWAGAHFRPADEEAHRLADAIVARALAAVPPLATAQTQ